MEGWLLPPKTFLFKLNKSIATTCVTTCTTTRSCGELWLVEGCLHMDLPLPLHQLQLIIWTSCGTNYGTKLISSGFLDCLLFGTYEHLPISRSWASFNMSPRRECSSNRIQEMEPHPMLFLGTCNGCLLPPFKLVFMEGPLGPVLIRLVIIGLRLLPYSGLLGLVTQAHLP